MSDTKPEKPAGGAIAAIISSLPGEVRGILSAFLVFFAFFALMYALINMPAYFKNLVSSTNAKEQCWELKEIQNAVFKFNKCTGEATQLEVKQPSPVASAAGKP
jgi:hypothetical protein